MNDKDIRWIQRFHNYQKAFAKLTKFIEKEDLNELELLGLIQSFEYTHELAWKTLKDFLEHGGHKEIYGSKDATREAFKLELIQDGDIWMKMIESRNETSHTYNQETTEKITSAILNEYYKEFVSFEERFVSLKEKSE